MFWGFPVSVATLPTLAAVASAIRYGTGGSPSWRVAPSTTGARTRQTTSFTKKAERTPEATTTAASRPRGIRGRIKTPTPRETEVFALVVTGMLNKQIASALGVGEKTVKVHRARVLEKMRAGSAAELVRLADSVGVSVPKS